VTATADPQVQDSPYPAASWQALGTYVQLVVADPRLIGQARQLAEELLAAVDLAYSRFRPDSDLVRANRQAGSWVAVSPLLVDAVEVAVRAAELTDGLVDPTLGLSLVAVGYDDDLDVVRARGELGRGPADLPAVLPALPARRGAWQELRIDPDGALRVPEGVAVDLGATGKAFAADLISAAVATQLGTGCVLSLGGDVSVGPDPAAQHDWQVAICEQPDDEPAEVVGLPCGGLATSTTTYRTWTHAGRTMHHLLDPSTGRPVEPRWRTASVQARTCVGANTATTATIVLGESAVAWLTERGLSARLVDRDGRVTRVGEWPNAGGGGPWPP
jgi:FAD:protein FMN transferase